MDEVDLKEMIAMNDWLLLVSILYGISGVVYAIVACRRIIRTNRMCLLDYVRLMYAFVYGFLPMLIYGLESNGDRNLRFYDYSPAGISRLVLFYLLSVCAYGAMNLGYFAIPKSRKSSSVIEQKDQNKANSIVVAGAICLLIGFVSLFMWTMAYGSLQNFMVYASQIRSGRGPIKNNFAFMKQFARILQVALYALVSGYLYGEPKKWKRVFVVALIACAVVGNYYFLLCSDSRASFLFVGIGIVSILITHRNKYSIRGTLFTSGIIMFILLLVTMMMDYFTNFIRYGNASDIQMDIIQTITTEFRFIPSTEMRVMRAWSEGVLDYQIGNDLLSALASWIPERFVPYKIPQSVWAYNTNLFGRLSSGTQPSGLVSTGVYEIGLIGGLIHPFLYGVVTAIFDRKLFSRMKSKYADVYKALCVGLFIQMVSHNQISTFVASLFPAFMFMLIVGVKDRINLKR